MRRHGLWLMMALAVAMAAAGAAPAQNPPSQSAQMIQPLKNVEIRHVDTVPKIDGVIEELWETADSATGFVQNQPYENTAPTERTTVFLLQDDDNLYVAFRCYSEQHPPTANFTKDEDYVSISFDPFGSKTSGYFFLMFGSGLFWDGLIMDDGHATDQSWEGVWYRANRMSPHKMEVEMKIPFKTVRYKKGLSQWGIQFRRHIAANFEDDYWTGVPQKDDDLVSRWGTARNIDPRSSGYYFELYPEGFTRYNAYRGKNPTMKPKGSLNLKWDLTPQTSLNATAYPDFAQIESDPFSVNLSRYPTYLQEQRPFFVEGTEIFRFSSFSNSGFFQPLNTFYSRRIGKSLDGSAVPIIGGMKLTHKTSDWNLGALGAFTDSYRKLGEGINEPSRSFGVLRAKRRVFGNSDVGLLASGTAAGGNNYNYSIGADAGLRRGSNQVIIQGGMSNRDGKKGWALESGYKGFNGRFLTMATYEAVGDSFDVQDIGFAPWAGRQQAMLISGPFWTFRSGAVRNLYVAPGISRSRQPGSGNWSTLSYFAINPTLRSNWGCNLEGNYGRNYETSDVTGKDVGYIYRGGDFNFWGVLAGNNINGGCYYNYSYNYRRHYLAPQGQNWFTFSYSFAPPVSATLNSSLWIEWDPRNRIVAMTPIFRPRVDYRLSPLMTLSVFNEMVASTPESHLARTRLQTDRLGLLYSWNFAPKSWLYAALNDYNALDYDTHHPQGVMKQQYGIGAVKLKYLLYF